tara:strand:- start:151 stop:576 length:426 start_codon:yes stop_codon:yes gene_type:complete
MNRITLVLILIAGLTYSCQLTDKGKDREITSDMIDNPSKIEFENTTFNFKEIAVGSSVEHVFKFKNVGETPLIIHYVKAQCGCTVPENWPKEPILPGEEGEIEVEFNPKKEQKNVSKYIAVIANTRPANTKLYLKGNVIGN